ncbi:AIR synthase-related protein [Natranaerobius thermophilus]|uniref:AIR synthase related protein domain protein n=1 Tax=Natranaerobius thermophilus (strain ATCC BAA-1301 / DSM 18059 / JW/NM-WN-LF) TaxID=457570 RepID=B2A162_NATTJ|nr:AIR synthase-related protein [Natranaerobius thermophilus]ACB84682.1 AIR synthase related protein domain protein [Natranaerobius thermophilus JW/NM-WN-LF]
MNQVEKALMHGLFIHLHHNIDKAIDFGQFKELNQKVDNTWPNYLKVGPDANDDAAVVQTSDDGNLIAAKMESHCSPCVPRPYDGSATGAGGAMRDVVAMGARPLFIMDFVGTRPLEEEVIVGPCGFQEKCTCGNCETMTSQERLNIMLKGIKDMCSTMDVFVAGGGFSTSFSDIVPAVVLTVIGQQITEEPLTKPAKEAGDKIIIIGETGVDGNDTLYRAGLVSELLPAQALFEEEKTTMEATLSAFKTGKVKACSDLGAAGIGAAVCESARFGGLGAEVELDKAPVKTENISPEERLICETQGRMLLQVAPENVDEVLEAISAKNGQGAVIGEITAENQSIFKYQGERIATIPNQPSDEILNALQSE